MTDLRPLGAHVLDVQQPDDTRFGHVVRHLYVARERWDLAVPDLPADLRRRARQAGCRPSEIVPGAGYHSAGETCRRHVLADHENWYLPATVSAVESASTGGHFGCLETRKGPRVLFVGANAVQVLTHTADSVGVQALVTAFRDPPGGHATSNEQFYVKAVRKLRDKTSLGSGDLL